MKALLINHKHFLMRALNLCILIAVCIGYHNIALARAKKEALIQKENQAATAVWKDGSYEGIGTGFGGNIKVVVTIKESSMKKIEIVEAKGEDSAYLDNAKKIMDTMIDNQTSEVDVASGATYSSKGIIEAVQNALKEAS